MNAYEEARGIEEEGNRRITPLLQRMYDRIEWVTDRKTQYMTGDVVGFCGGERYTIEIKHEQVATGNVFLEEWSNLDTYKDGWMRRPINPSVIVFHFFDGDGASPYREGNVAYFVRMDRLLQWAYRKDQIYSGRYRLVTQKAREQNNVTAGRAVPLATLRTMVGYDAFRVSSTEMIGSWHPQASLIDYMEVLP